MKIAKILIFASIITILILLNNATLILPAEAQQENRWFPRQRIPGSDDEARSPYLVTDQNRTVHAFFSQPMGNDKTARDIVYSRWTLDQGWTEPTDILLPPIGNQAVVKGAFLDRDGMMHVIFYAGEAGGANIYYSEAPAVNADQARAWSAPEMIGEDAIVETAAMLGDDKGNLFVLYSGNQTGSGLYAVISSDNGNTWSNPTPVYLASEERFFPYLIHLTLDQKDQLHAVWSVNNPQGQGEAIYYIRLESDHRTWSDPFLLAQARESQLSQVTDPAIVAFGDELFVIYNTWPVNDNTHRAMRRSLDGGRTWLEAVEPFASIGEYGSPNFVIDSNNTLHVFLGDRARGLNLYHSTWQDQSWNELEPIAPPSAAQIQVGPLTFHPWFPQAAVSQGNILLVTWETDRGATHNGIWYTYKILDAPELPLVPLPTQALLLTSSAKSQIMPGALLSTSMTNTASTITTSLTTLDGSGSNTVSSPSLPIFIGIIPVLGLILGIVAAKYLFKHS